MVRTDIRSESDRTPIRRSETEIRNGLPRTYERTDVDITNHSLTTHLGRRETSSSDIESLGEVIQAGFLPTSERHPVIRRGERDVIPYHIRMGVLYRDGFHCQLCPSGYSKDAKELDHIIPWSAGGSDRTENLRVLCEAHNQERSNHVTPDERIAVPVTWWCDRCFTSEHVWNHRQGIPACAIHGEWNGYTKIYCRVQRAYMVELQRTSELPTWHRRNGIEYANQIAYCAHCDLRAMTDVTL